jgi:hypothetical protein
MTPPTLPAESGMTSFRPARNNHQAERGKAVLAYVVGKQPPACRPDAHANTSTLRIIL